MASPREAQKLQTRRLLRDTALEQSQAKGYGTTTIDEIFTGADDPPLATVVERGERALVEAWLSRKFDQWAEAGLDAWFEDVAGAMHDGLDRADRFDAETRRIRAVLAFGRLEYLSKRWLRVGWAVDREICLRTLTDSWCHLLTQGA